MPLTLKNFYKQWWQPWANTLCYYTFNDTLADASWNHANASNISSCTFTAAYTWSTKKVLNKPNWSYISLPATFLQTAVSTYTMLFWFKSSQSSAVWLMGCNSSSDYDWNVEADIDHTWIGFLYGRTYSYRRQAKNTSTYRDWNRHLISIRRWTWDVIVWVDKNFTTTYYINTPSNYSIWGNGISWWIWTRSTDSGWWIHTTSVFQLWDFITENKYWSDAEVEAYIDQTKDLYGVSLAKGWSQETPKEEEKKEEIKIDLWDGNSSNSWTGDVLKL